MKNKPKKSLRLNGWGIFLRKFIYFKRINLNAVSQSNKYFIFLLNNKFVKMSLLKSYFLYNLFLYNKYFVINISQIDFFICYYNSNDAIT